ncbi:hypothetical protein [Streptomyces sp. NPDC057579]|uniref:hypothetical protein n=1 Tax=Streptomyces sp. NPDC057579 TaxID=3346172 RepID=UPI00367EB1E1
MTTPVPPTAYRRPLVEWRGRRPVPYITAWSGEVDVSINDLRYGARGLIYANELPSDRDQRGGLWERWVDDYGTGEPAWRNVHSERQRTCMEQMWCQVCARPASRTHKGYLFLAGGPATLGDMEGTPNGQPPLCLECAPTARKLCPHLRESVAFRARKAPVWGVLGSLIALERSRLNPEAVRLRRSVPEFVKDGSRERPFVLGSQLLREMRRVTVVDLDAELAAAGLTA